MTQQHAAMSIWVSEDDLTDALFYETPLTSRGSCSKDEARAQARLMLSAPQLLARIAELEAALREIQHEVSGTYDGYFQDALSAARIVELTRAAIAKAEGQKED